MELASFFRSTRFTKTTFRRVSASLIKWEHSAVSSGRKTVPKAQCILLHGPTHTTCELGSETERAPLKANESKKREPRTVCVTVMRAQDPEAPPFPPSEPLAKRLALACIGACQHLLWFLAAIQVSEAELQLCYLGFFEKPRIKKIIYEF